MGVYSTLSVSREVALAAYNRLNRIQPSNEELEQFLDAHLDTALMNVQISHEPDPQDEEILRRYT